MKKENKILGFIAIAIAMFMGTLDSTIINIALPDITSYFNATINDTSWISTIYVLSLSVFMISASKIADQIGRKKVMIVGLLLFGVSSSMCGLSNSLIFLIIMRGIQGIGGAIITPIVVPIALDAFGKEKTTIVAGAIGAITALAAAGGPPIGGLLIEYVNWQSIFFINVPFALISIILTILFVRESYDHTASKKIDWMGMILLSATLFLLTFALLKGEDYGWGSVTIISMFSVSAASMILFIITELKVEAPMMELVLFKEMTFTTSTICYLITGFAIVAPGLVFNYFLQNAIGYSALHAAMIVTPMALTVIISMPLGSVISKRLDARVVNFLGILGLGIGCFMLSRLTVNTSEPTMIGEMIIFGFALGFSVQALISSIKYLPEEKSGMGSGIVNAARQIGTCIGIAILITVLNIHIIDAKDDIKGSVLHDIDKSTDISQTVKNVMIKDVNESLDGSDNNNQKDDVKEKMENDIKNTLENVSSVTRPQNNEVLGKLYDGANRLSNGSEKATEGQKELSDGLRDLNSGISKLYDGGTDLTSGQKSLTEGITKAQAGSQQLTTAGSNGSSRLISGINKINAGADQLLSQFSQSTDPGKPTVYDAVTGISKGADSLSTNADSYVTAVNNTIFNMIKNDPTSVKLLDNYKESLSKAKTAYENADPSSKQLYSQQIQMLSNLVNIYSIGTDTSVSSESVFEEKLNELANKDDKYSTVVSSGSKVRTGTAKLQGATEQLYNQFNDGGSFKRGMKQLANGIDEMAGSVGELNNLQEGLRKLSVSLAQIRNGSVELYDADLKLQNGIKEAQQGGNDLETGSSKLEDASKKITDGSNELVKGLAQAGQKDEIQGIMDNLSSNKDNKIAGAFDKTFFVAAIILVLASLCGLFTDKRNGSEMIKTDEITMEI